MEPYQYTPLPSATSIRVLVLQTSKAHGALATKFSLEETDLQSPQNYEALSYTWGETTYYNGLTYQWDNGPPRTFPISIKNSGFLEITRNLDNFLQHLIENTPEGNCTRRLWADQICINQRDVEERSQQVTLMGDVYRKAQRTLIWIGKEDGDTRAVLELLHAMSTPEFECQEKLDYNLLRNLQDRVEKVLVSESDPEQIVNDDYITKFVNILNKPWFSRAWIVQEAALSPHPAVLLGSELFDLRMLYHLLLAVSSLEANTSTHRSIRSSRVLRARGAHTLHHIQTCRLQLQDQAPVQHRLPFLDILRRLAFSVDASDARDQVYAFLALQDPLQIQIKPDYSLDTIDAYAVVSASLAKSTCSLSILGLTRWGPSPFPSWAVDWRLHKSTQGRPFDRDGRENFDACHGYPYRAVDDFKVGSNYLTARGRLVARVAVVSQVAHHSKLLPQAWNIEEVVKSLTLGSRFDEVSLQDYSQSELSKRVLAVLMALDTKTFESDRERDEWLGTMLRVYENYERIVKKDVALADLSHLRVVAKDLARRVGISGNKRVFCSKEGLIGLGPQPINRNDFVWILHGSKVPVILRKWNRDYYIVVGQCYYEKWMYGDVVDWKEDEGDVVNLA